MRTKSVDAVAVLPLEREIQIGARRVAERRAPDVADAPDDLGGAVAEPDALADRVSRREVALGERHR